MLLFCDSFNTTVDLTAKYGSTVTFESLIAGRFDATALRISGFSNIYKWTKGFGNKATVVVGAAIRVGTGTTWSKSPILAVGDANTVQAQLTITSASGVPATFQIQRGAGSADLGSASTATMTIGAWHYIEMQVTVDPTVGAVSVWLDGTQILNLTGQNTRNTSNSFGNVLGLCCNGSQIDFDDVYIIDTSGSFNNSRLGDVKIVGSLPTANGTATAYTQNVAARANSTAYALGVTILDSNSNLQRVTTAGTSGGSAPTWSTTVGGTTTDSGVTWTNFGTQAAYKLVNETTADEDSSYLSDATVNDQSRFTFPGTTGSVVKAVMVYARARKDDAGARSIRTVAKSGATTGDNGSDLALSATYQTLAGLFETDPATSAAWTVAAVNGAEFGVKTTV